MKLIKSPGLRLPKGKHVWYPVCAKCLRSVKRNAVRSRSYYYHITCYLKFWKRRRLHI